SRRPPRSGHHEAGRVRHRRSATGDRSGGRGARSCRYRRRHPGRRHAASRTHRPTGHRSGGRERLHRARHRDRRQLAHPSAPLVAAGLAAAEIAGRPGAALLDAYVVGFEIEGRLGRTMNPRHYQRGWHCTATIGTLGAAAAAARLLGLDARQAAHALAIAASEASGLKENFGTMVKPLHAGLAARNGVLAAQLAKSGMTASAAAIEGPQGFLAAMDSSQPSLAGVVADLGTRWEILDTGITVKLYPSCAGTHPALDALLDLKRRERFAGGDVESVEIGVDPIVPTILIYDRPSSGLEGKFSMPFCAAAALVHGQVGLETFEASPIADPAIVAMQSRITMRIDPALDASAPPLTQARVTVRLRDGRVLTASANGARGYHDRPASEDELAAKFMSCAVQAMSEAQATAALAALRSIESAADVRDVTTRLESPQAFRPAAPTSARGRASRP